jgi:hypothetical protein
MAHSEQGKLIQILPLESGTSKAGKDWSKQTIIIETEEKYPKKLAIDLNADLINKIKEYKLGQIITCQINLESREYNGKWFTSVKAWRFGE